MTLLLAEDNKLKIAYGIKGLHILEFLPDEMGDNILSDFLYWFAPETLRAMEFTDGLKSWNTDTVFCARFNLEKCLVRCLDCWLHDLGDFFKVREQNKMVHSRILEEEHPTRTAESGMMY